MAPLDQHTGATTVGLVVPIVVDRFKDINDRHGHAAGDAVLASVGALLRRSMRGADAIARHGGEEFLVIVSQAGAEANNVASRLLDDWRATDPRTTISAGVTLHRRGEPPEEALARADEALYEAKRRGRDRIQYAA